MCRSVCPVISNKCRVERENPNVNEEGAHGKTFSSLAVWHTNELKLQCEWNWGVERRGRGLGKATLRSEVKMNGYGTTRGCRVKVPAHLPWIYNQLQRKTSIQSEFLSLRKLWIILGKKYHMKINLPYEKKLNVSYFLRCYSRRLKTHFQP